MHIHGHVNQEIARHHPGRTCRFCILQQGCLTLESVGYVLFGTAERQYIADRRTGKHQYYEPD